MVLAKKKKKREREANVSMKQTREPRKIASHKFSQLIFEKGAKAIQQAKIIFSTNGSGTNEYPHVKKSLDTDLQPFTKFKMDHRTKHER